MKKRDFKEIFRDTDEKTIGQLSKHFTMSEQEKQRVFEMSERRLENMKRKDGKDERFEVVNVNKENGWTRWARVAACFAVLVVGAGAFGMIHRVSTRDKDTNSETLSQSTADTAFESESSSVSENSSDRAAESKKADTNQKKNESKAESGKNASSSRKSESRKSTSSVKNSDDSTAADKNTTAEKQNEPKSLKDRLMDITEDMTVREVLDCLGTDETSGLEGDAAVYCVDGRLVMIFYSDENEKIGKSGETLYNESPLVSEMYANADENTFDCYVLWGGLNGVRVICPQYSQFHYADISFDDDVVDDVVNNLSAFNYGDLLRITYDGYVRETYPVQIRATRVRFVDSVQNNVGTDRGTESEPNTDMGEYSEGRRGYASRADVLRITEEMSLNDIIDLLGEPNDFYGAQGIASYTVDLEKVIIIHFTNPNEPVGKSGQTLLNEGFNPLDMYRDPDNFTFEGVVFERNVNTLGLVCPQYDYFDVVYVRISDDMKERLGNEFTANNTHLIVKYDGTTVESNAPAVLYAQSIGAADEHENIGESD